MYFELFQVLKEKNVILTSNAMASLAKVSSFSKLMLAVSLFYHFFELKVKTG